MYVRNNTKEYLDILTKAINEKEVIKAIRSISGAGMMTCKNALKEAVSSLEDDYKEMINNMKSTPNQIAPPSIPAQKFEISKLKTEVKIVENSRSGEFEEEVNKYLVEGYSIESSACNSSKYKAILVKIKYE